MKIRLSIHGLMLALVMYSLPHIILTSGSSDGATPMMSNFISSLRKIMFPIIPSCFLALKSVLKILGLSFITSLQQNTLSMRAESFSNPVVLACLKIRLKRLTFLPMYGATTYSFISQRLTTASLIGNHSLVPTTTCYSTILTILLAVL